MSRRMQTCQCPPVKEEWMMIGVSQVDYAAHHSDVVSRLEDRLWGALEGRHRVPHE